MSTPATVRQRINAVLGVNVKFQPYYRIFSFRQVPILVHWSVLLAFPFAWAASQSLVAGCVGLIAVLVLMLVHEVGHALVARHFGLRVFSIRLYPIHGLCVHEAPHSPEVAIAISWGGVAAQAILFIAAVLTAKVIATLLGRIPTEASSALTVFIPVNLLVVFVNLLPIRPLDGATAWKLIPLAGASALAYVQGRRSRHKRSHEIASLELKRIATTKPRKPDNS